MRPIKVLIADDHTLFRRGLAGLLNETDEFRVVGEAGSGPEAARLAAELLPDVILLDVHMPGGGGVVAVRQLRETTPALPVIMLTVSESDADLVDAIQAGARGYLLKNTETGELFAALRRAISGQAVLDPSLTDSLFRHVARVAPAPATGMPLSARETEILRLIAAGHTNREIADQLSVSENTIKSHVAHILEKLHATTRGEAVALARARSWLA